MTCRSSSSPSGHLILLHPSVRDNPLSPLLSFLTRTFAIVRRAHMSIRVADTLWQLLDGVN